MTQIHWANAVSGAFDTATNWTGDVVPGSSDDAFLDAAGSTPYTVAITANQTVNTIHTAANATLDIEGSGVVLTTKDSSREPGVSDVNAGSIIISNGGTFNLGASLVNSGAIQLNGSGSATYLTGGAAYISGGGSIELSDSASNVWELDRYGGLIGNIDNTISGAGQLGNGVTTEIVNHSAGVIDASGVHNALVLSVGRYAITNYGLLEATGEGGLVIKSTVVQVDFNSKSSLGVILAGAGDTVTLQSAEIYGGYLRGPGTFAVVGADNVWKGSASGLFGLTWVLNNDSNVQIESGATLKLGGPIVNSGGITLEGNGARTNLIVSATLSGGGTITLSGAEDSLYGQSKSALVNVDNTITGSGFIGIGALDLTNESAGVIDAVGKGNLQVNTSGETLTNSGLMEATSGGTLTIALTTVNQSGGGTIRAAAGAMAVLADADVIGGMVGVAGGGVVYTSAAGNKLDGTASAVGVAGRLDVQSSSNLTIQGTIVNSGQISLLAEGAAADLIVGAVGATLTGSGQVIIRKDNADLIKGATAAATLTNVNNVIIGDDGNLGDGVMTLVNDAGGTIRTDTGTSFTIDTGANTITNAGMIAATTGGTITVKSAVDNTGTLSVGGGDLILDGAVTGAGTAIINGGTLNAAGAFSEAVTFGKTGELILADSQGYGGALSGFSHTGTTSLDLADVTFTTGVTTASYVDNGKKTGGVLTVTNGTQTATITLAGNYTTSTFTVSGDGHGGTTVVDPMTPSPHAFVSAVAAFAPNSAGAIHASATSQNREVMVLARP